MSKRIFLLSLVVLLWCASAAAHDGAEKVQFGERIVVREGEEAKTVVCFFCSVDVKGAVGEDVVVFFGDLRVSGEVGGNTVVFGGTEYLSPGARVGNDAVIMGGYVRAAAGSAIGHDRIVFPPVLFLVPLLILAGIVLAFIYLVRSVLSRRRMYPMQA